ncbi:MAG: hypothetical protein KGL39_17495 [Patescibacteria group bacterium]|nr:hypothetical protein [Patescibacteria group bacterium]
MIRTGVAKAIASSDPLWSRVHAVADAEVSAVEAAFLEAVARLHSQLTRKQIEAAIAMGDPEAVIAAIDWQATFDDPLLQEWQTILGRVMGRAGAMTAEAELHFAFDLRDPGFFEAVDQRGAQLVREVSEETRAAIRSAVSQAYRDGVHPLRIAGALQDMVGLTERQQLAVLHYWEKLAADGKRSAKQVDEMTQNYAQRLLAQRGKTIARTETINAANGGRYESYLQAADRGLFARNLARVQWLASEDERTCRICMALDDETVLLGQPFESLEGPLMYPTAHPMCRCTTILLPEG